MIDLKFSKYDSTLASVSHRTQCFENRLKELQPDLTLIGEYINFTTKVYVRNKYGVCYCLPSRLLAGAIPCIRTAVDKTVYFINQAEVIHGKKYDYSLTIWDDSSKTVQIGCYEHGVFTQRKQHHLKGQGCKKCTSKNAGGWYDKTENFNKPSNLYILEFTGNGECFMKFGIAVDINKRISRIRNQTRGVYVIKLLKIKPNTAKYCYDLEQRIKQYVKNKKLQYVPQIHFDGKFECFRIKKLSNQN